MKPDILVFGSIWPDDALGALERHFTLHRTETPDAALASRVRAVLTTGTLGIAETLAAALPALEIVSVHGVGVDPVPVAQLAQRGVIVTNTPDVLTHDVADLALALVLAVARRLPALDRYVRAGQWGGKGALQPGRSVTGKVAGIYGYGRIGQAVAARLRACGMQIRYHQRNEGPEPALRCASLLELAAQSDVLVACTPGGAGTRRSIDAAVLDALGPEGTLINIARGSVVDEAALVTALQAGRLGAAGLDVFEDEPSVPEALFAMDNVVLTPHVGSFTAETRRAMRELAVENLVAHFDGRGALTPV
jgi:lactate dehydrogenase-like 2-hydroxyacid dehydrogenase